MVGSSTPYCHRFKFDVDNSMTFRGTVRFESSYVSHTKHTRRYVDEIFEPEVFYDVGVVCCPLVK